MREWLRTRGRALLGLLSDLGGALAFVVAAIALAAAALTGTVLLLLGAFPQPFLTMLVLAVALFAAGLALHLLRGRLEPPRHEQEKVDAEERDRLPRERRAIRRIREELLDNKHALARVSGNLDELLSLRFNAWREEETTLLELADPTPHLDASAGYRELYGLCRGRVDDSDFGGQYTHGDPPGEPEMRAVEIAIDRACKTLLRATEDG